MTAANPAPDKSSLLKGQVALVTGASSGLGYRFAATLAAAGAHVAVAARRIDRLDALVQEIRAFGGTAIAIPLDVADATAIPAAVDAVEEALGPVTILVNNAGTSAGIVGATQQTVDEVDQMLAVNIRGPFLLATEVARRLIDSGKSGRIVNIASIGAFSYDAKIPAALYVTSKSAVVKMTEALAVEWAKFHINVNAIAPGFFRSEMSAQALAQFGADYLSSRQTRKRIGEPHMLDSSLLYLVSPESEAVTGTCIKVDDGQMPR